MNGWKQWLDATKAENDRLARRRRERDEALILERLNLARAVMPVAVNRVIRRMGLAGQPRSRIFSELMKVPKGRRR